MPIYHKPTPQTAAAANEIADHTSDAAKMKRTREQAYFNSYDFDAIEVLPNGDDDDDDAESMHHHQHRHHQHSYHHQQQQQPNSARQLPFNSKYQQQSAPCLNGQMNPKRLPTSSSLSSKSNSSMPSSSNSSSRSSTSLAVYPAGMPLTKTQAHEQRNYLQRLGALFKKSEHSQTTDLSKQPAHLQSPRELVLDVRNCVSRNDENFLLPRAILKYPSTGNITNSMPLTEVATTALTATNTAANGKLQSAQNHFANVKQGNTGFVAATSAAVNTVARNKKQSTSSSITTATTASLKHSSAGNDDDDVVDDGHDDDDDKSANDDDEDFDEGIVVQSQASTATLSPAKTKLRPPMLRIPTATTIISNSSNSSSSAADLAQQQQQQQQSKTATAAQAHGRASSHQSHYSTDKSGSSGYYSSNVCSTYSLDDHIYCEPVIDIIELPPHAGTGSEVASKSGIQAAATKKVTTTSLALSMQRSGHQQQHHQQQQQQEKKHSQSQILKQDAASLDDVDGDKASAPYSENLRILETSIENLDRHLKNCPSMSAQERIASFVQTTHSSYTASALDALPVYAERQRLQHLPTIMEGGTLPADKQKQNWQPLPDDDDSLLDIDLDSFLLVNERSNTHKQLSTVKPLPNRGGIDNPGFMQDVEDVDDADDNNYKCAKYINSCPEDAYRVESDIVPTNAEHTARVASSLKRYEEQLHFQNTRELLEDVRDKIRLLSRSRNDLHGSGGSASAAGDDGDDDEDVPKELEGMIKTLKHELEEYLQRMNQHSELEIRQLCSGISKNQHIVKMKNAFQRRQSLSHSNSLLTSEFAAYEAIRDGVVTTTTASTAAATALDVGIGVRHQITTIRCASDPNFKMKRKSLTEVFPIADCYIETITDDIQQQQQHSGGSNSLTSMTQQITQLQRNLSFHKPLLSQLDAVLLHADAGQGGHSVVGGGNKKQVTVSSSEDRDSLASWHRKKPSIWEMYYGTNRLNQTLLGKRGNSGVVVNSSSQATLSYPSSRPESDFTLDLPRAEQLRIKMEKEKKFRQRCRYITTFLSLIFFLLTVMVVSLVLTRGKRMFGSMI